MVLKVFSVLFLFTLSRSTEQGFQEDQSQSKRNGNDSVDCKDGVAFSESRKVVTIENCIDDIETNIEHERSSELYELEVLSEAEGSKLEVQEEAPEEVEESITQSEVAVEPTQEEVESQEIKVATYNLWGSEVTSVQNKAKSLNAAMGPDILCLQELDTRNKKLSYFSNYMHQMVEMNETQGLAGTISDGVSKLVDGLKGIFGLDPLKQYISIALLSKYPIRAHETKVIQRNPGGDKWNRYAIYAEVMIENKPLKVFVITIPITGEKKTLNI